MAPENVDRVILNIRWNRVMAITSIVIACCSAFIWSNHQVTNILNAIRDNAKDNEVIRQDITEMKTRLEKQGYKVEVLWYKESERQ